MYIGSQFAVLRLAEVKIKLTGQAATEHTSMTTRSVSITL